VVDFLQRTRDEVAVSHEMAEQTIEALSASARTGNIGDGKIFVTSLEQSVRIRTGETGEAAL